MISYYVKPKLQFSYAAIHCFRASVTDKVSKSHRADLKKARSRQQHLATQYCHEGHIVPEAPWIRDHLTPTSVRRQCSMQCLPTPHLWLKKSFGQEEGWSQGCGHSYCRLITQKKFNTNIFYESLPVQTSYKSTPKHKVLLKCPLQDALPCKQPLLSQVLQPGAEAEEQQWNTRHRTPSLCK